MRYINEIIIHCSATKEGLDFNVNDLRRWHKAQGWKDVGYHFVITLDGTIEQGRALEEIGSHTKGHNAHSIGICYIGGISKDGKPKDTRTIQQKAALCDLLNKLCKKFPDALIFGHNDFTKAKACPCFDVQKEYGDYNKMVLAAYKGIEDFED